MSDLHQAAATLGVSIVTVAGWAFDKLPSIAAGVSIAFIVWQWRRMALKDRALKELNRDPG